MQIKFIVDLASNANTLLSPQQTSSITTTRNTFIPLGLTGGDNIILKNGNTFTLEGSQAVHLRKLIESGQVGGVIKLFEVPFARPGTSPPNINIDSTQFIGLLNWWPFLEGDSTLINDVVGGQNGTISIGHWVTDSLLTTAFFGQETPLDPFNEQTFMDLHSTESTPNKTTPFTASLWIFSPSGQDELDVTLFRKENVDDNSFFFIVATNVGTTLVRLHASDFTGIEIQTTDGLVDGWQLFTVTYDGSGFASGFHIYINGVELGVSVLQDDISDAPVIYGADFIGTEVSGIPPVNTLFADLRWYGRALSSNEVVELFNPNTRWELYLK